MFSLDNSSRHAISHDVIGNVFDNHRARADDRTGADADSVLHYRSDTNQCPASQADAAADYRARRHMHPILDNAFMMNTGIDVYDHVLANPGAGTDNGAGGDYGPRTD